jgi:hypothetical protein
MNRKLADARIGYGGYSRDFAHPGDRRRFCAYAEQRGLTYEQAKIDRPYDAVLITHNGDIAGWTARKRRDGDRLRFVFELVDSYFEQKSPMRRFLKGTGRYALGTESRLSPDFYATLTKACEAADAVICSTLEQREAILRYNPNVIVSFDWFGGDLGPPKADYRRSERLRLVWEGQSTTVPNLQVLREPLNDLRDRVELHVVTDPSIHRYFGRFAPYPSRQALQGIECPIVMHEWQRDSFHQHITSSDVAVIPIETRNRLWRGKPENKLVLLWKLGMPVLTTSTPVYERTMAAAGLDLACESSARWGEKLQQMVDASAAELERIGLQGREHARKAYSDATFLSVFDTVFSSIGFGPA